MIQTPRLSNKQRDIVDACKSNKVVVVSTGRQCGKTFTDQIMALYWLLNEGMDVGFFEPTYKQCKKVYKDMRKWLMKLPRNVFIFNGTDLTITFAKTGKTISFWTAENDNCRGLTFQAVIVDEACFVKDDIFTAAILPTVSVALSKGTGRLLLTSTPKTRNWFYDYFVKSMSDKVSITFTSEEGGLLSADYLDMARKVTPAHIYRNEYLAEFVDSGDGIFDYTDCIENTTEVVGTVAALDIGIKNDATVLTVMNKERVISIYRWVGEDWTLLVNKINDTLRLHGKPQLYVETNGVGQVPYQMLRKLYGSANPWATTNKSKNDVINKLSADFQSKNIKIINDKQLITELDNFEYKYDPSTSALKYGARNGFNDDCVMSLAIANYHRNKGKISIMS